jgi:protein involved in polysaccharide export with SLBB domain
VRKIISILIIAGLIIPCLPVPVMAQLGGIPLNMPTSVTSLTGGQSSLSLLQGGISDNYLLGPGDELEAHLIIGNNALVLDYNFVINPEGKIFFPNVAELDLSGLTLKQAKALMIREIKKKYDQDFNLYLMVSNSKKINIFVTGQVDNPGMNTVPDGTRIAEVLKLAGVAKGGSDLTEKIYVKRQTPTGEFKLLELKLYDIYLGNDEKQNIALENGDVIAVPAIKSYVYVYGEISRGGTFGYVPGQTLSDYLNIAGGPTPRANLSDVSVTRQENGQPKVYKINASDIIQRGMTSKDITIYPGDVINVPGNFFYFSDFASFANTILLALTLYNTVK